MPRDPYDSAPRSKFEGYIPGKGYDVQAGEPTPPAVAITSEIAARLLDLRDLDRRKPVRLLNQLLRLYRLAPAMLWAACEILAANRQGGKSLAEIGAEQNCSKQAVHQEQKRSLQRIAETMPEVAEAMATILGRTRPEK